MSVKNIYDMKLHESFEFDEDIPFEVLRVPNGWIYTRYSNHAYAGDTTTFVPYADAIEFK